MAPSRHMEEIHLSPLIFHLVWAYLQAATPRRRAAGMLAGDNPGRANLG